MKSAAAVMAIIFTAISAYFVQFAVTMDTTVAGNSDAAATGLDRVVNLQLMQVQVLNLQIGLAAAVVAAIFWAAIIIVTGLETPRTVV